MIMSEACCSAGSPVISDYKARGTVEKVGDIDMYVSERGRGAKVAVVVVYDIFGFHENVKQVR